MLGGRGGLEAVGHKNHFTVVGPQTVCVFD